MQGRTVSEALGCVPIGTPMSNNEFQWWVARSRLKPLPSQREELHNSRSLFFSMGNSGESTKRPFKQPKNAMIDWFKVKDSEDEDFMAYVQKVAKEQEANG
jgi:glucan biosynthesis protein